MLSHFHTDFPFNHDSTWITATYAGGTGPYEWKPPGEGKFINVNFGSPSIMDFRHYYSSVSEKNFLRAMGVEASTYWLLKNSLNFDQEYFGVTSYRRYLLLIENNIREHKIIMPATKESCDILSGEESKQNALKILEKYDMIINRPVDYGISMEEQYLLYELPEYWNLFKEAIVKVNPSYKKHINILTTRSLCHYEGVFITKREIFHRMMNEYFDIMQYVWKNCSEVYPDKTHKHYDCSEPLPWRYSGFLNERFVPFFIYANNLNIFEVPLVLLK
jgi:hypothetical protein